MVTEHISPKHQLYALLRTGWALNFVLRHHPKSMLKIILTLVTLQGGMLARLPNVSYLTFFSYWSLFCIMPIYSMVWQWTTSNTVGNISAKTAVLTLVAMEGEKHGEHEAGKSHLRRLHVHRPCHLHRLFCGAFFW